MNPDFSLSQIDQALLDMEISVQEIEAAILENESRIADNSPLRKAVDTLHDSLFVTSQRIKQIAHLFQKATALAETAGINAPHKEILWEGRILSAQEIRDINDTIKNIETFVFASSKSIQNLSKAVTSVEEKLSN